jgi:hypothetical protein
MADNAGQLDAGEAPAELITDDVSTTVDLTPFDPSR